MDTEFKPGINYNAEIQDFTRDEIQIIEVLSKRDWYVTRAERIKIANSYYKVILIKPSPAISNSFNLHREVVVAFSPYQEFEPRSIDAIEYLNIQELRLEEICSILISNDDDVEKKVNTILKTNEEARVIIPFSYSEILKNKDDSEFFVNKLRTKFYSRDLFGIQDPLKKDLYFFGRRDLIYNLINRHLNSENSGIFGLRKTGKTSILYSIERALDRKQSISIFIDCQTLHLKSWNVALRFIVQELQQKTNVKISNLKILKGYDDLQFVADYFLADMKTIYRKNNKKSILLIFDEIENITFDTSISSNWKSGQDFIKFWQVIRSTYQNYRDENVFTYLITGTNPRAIEKSTIDKIDNPIFAQFPAMYIPPFDFIQTKEMLDKLGGYVGLAFDEITCTRLIEDFGGHPLLMRQMCSFIHRKTSTQRPIAINRSDYDSLKEQFYKDENGFIKYAQMVLEVLENWYPDEFQMLTWMSVGENQTFEGLAKESPEYITHLLNYGIIERNNLGYGFKIESLKLFLSNKNKYKRLNLSNEDKQSEMNSRRNTTEPKLRRIVKTQLRIMFGETEAKKKVITEIYGADKVGRYSNKIYADFFDPSKHNIYYKNLFDLIRKNWDHGFDNMFETNVDIFVAKTTLINYLRKGEAHAAFISDSDFTSFRGAMEWLETKLMEY